MLLDSNASFELARRLRRDGVSLAEAFAFMSGLYFRGKLSYARTFTNPVNRPVFVITTNRGLMPADQRITVNDLKGFCGVPIDASDKRYSEPLIRDATTLSHSHSGSVVLLGSIATGKYVDHLLPIFGDNLQFPVEFVGRGDMSRGGLLLRSAIANQVLTHVPIAGAIRRGRRPPKLAGPATRSWQPAQVTTAPERPIPRQSPESNRALPKDSNPSRGYTASWVVRRRVRG
jgi:hypothetical protein